MPNFQHKNKNKFIGYHPIILLILGIVVFFFGFGVVGFLDSMEDTIRNKKVAENKVRELEMRKAELINDIENLNTDSGKERVFRENFGLAKEGEGVIVIVEDQNSIPNIEEEKKGFFGFIKDLFK